MSIFQDVENIKLNSSNIHAEEEEAIEDQKRRDEEIANQLQNAFDDLEADENSLELSSTFHSKLLETNQPQNLKHVYDGIDHEDLPLQANNNNSHNDKIYDLEMIIHSQRKQIKSYEEIATEEKKKREELEKKLSISEAERERVISTKNFEHELLVESKEKCSNLENEVTKFKSEVKLLEMDNDILREKLENSQTLLADIQNKYNIIEKRGYAHYEKNVETRYKNLEDSYQSKIQIMQQKIDSLNNKLDEKENEIEKLNAKYLASQKQLESLLIARASKINEISDAVINAQKSNDQLSWSGCYSQEHDQKTDLQRQNAKKDEVIAKLKSEQDIVDAELETIIKMFYENSLNDSARRRTEEFPENYKLANQMGKVNELKREINHVIKKYRDKCNHLKKYQEIIDSQTEEIKTLRKEENVFLVQITTLKEENIRLENRIKNITEEFHENKDRITNKIEIESRINELKDTKKRLQDEIHLLEKTKTSIELQINNLKNLEKNSVEDKNEHTTLKKGREEFSEPNNEIHQKNSISESNAAILQEKNILENKLNELTSPKKDLKNNNQSDSKILALENEDSENTFVNKKNDRKGRNQISCHKCTINEAETIKLKTTCLKSKNDIDILTTQLNQAKKLISEMYEKIGLCNQQTEVIVELKAKADKFEEYIKTHYNVSDNATSDIINKISENNKDSDHISKNCKQVEAQIREQMAQIFATKLKACERMYQSKILELENHNLAIQDRLHKVCNDLRQRQNEVELLKHVILSEREKSKEMLTNRCIEIEEKLQRQSVILHKCRDGIKMKNQLIAELRKELEERQLQIEAERKSMKAVMEQWEKNQKTVSELEENWRREVEEINKHHETLMLSLKSKYNSAKKTAENYKRYAEDKEKHMLNEYDRIKSEYELSIAKIEARTNASLERKKKIKPATDEIMNNEDNKKNPT